MKRTLLLLAPVVAALASATPPAAAGPCVQQDVPRRGEVTVCVDDRGCDLYVDPGGRTIAACIELRRG